ncbi:MAG: HPr family phosphocarrier protein [Lachnospiraceae bacterium]
MRKFSVLLDSVEKIKNFCDVTNQFDIDVDVIAGHYMIDAKSILGILSMDLTEPIKFKIHTMEEAEADGIISEMQGRHLEIKPV